MLLFHLSLIGFLRFPSYPSAIHVHSLFTIQQILLRKQYGFVGFLNVTMTLTLVVRVQSVWLKAPVG